VNVAAGGVVCFVKKQFLLAASTLPDELTMKEASKRIGAPEGFVCSSIVPRNKQLSCRIVPARGHLIRRIFVLRNVQIM
jgi:hypothetical protein